jgi:glycosyltransferase involved in cell wall biosynthesis
MPQISIVIPMYNEQEVLEKLFSRLSSCLEPITHDYEIICVNDGSRDETLERLKQYHKQDNRIKIINFARNFGKEIALTAGIDYTKGNAVIPIDADLQDPPELIAQMVDKWRNGYKVVLATRRNRPGDSWFKRKTAEWFYSFMNSLSTVKVPANTGDFRLMDRQVIEAVKKLPERTRFMKGIFAWTGFSTTTVYFDRESRAAGSTSWNYWKLWKFALDGIFSFTTIPLHIWTYIGGAISIFAFIWAVVIIIQSLIFGIVTPGYPSLMVTMLFLGGIQLLSIGVLGEYIGRIYTETKQRPLYLVEDEIGINGLTYSDF